MNTFTLKILAAERVFYDGACASLTVPTLDGLYGVQARHEDFILAVVPGTLTVKTDLGDEIVAAVSLGVLKMEDNEALLLADTVERADEIDERRAERAALRAKEELLQKKSAQEQRLAEQHMARALSRLKTAKHRGGRK